MARPRPTRSLMAQVALHAGHDPDRVSFVAALRIARQTVTHQGAFPLTTTSERLWQAFVRTLLTRLNQGRRLRTAPRVIKREMTKLPVERAHHADWPQP